MNTIYIGVFIIVLFIVYDKLKYNNARHCLNLLYKHYKSLCHTTSNIKEYSQFSEKKKMFIEDLGNHIGCTNIKNVLHLKINEIFCIKYTDLSNKCNKLVHLFDKYYCVSNIYELQHYIEKLYDDFINIHKDYDTIALNKKIFGKDYLENDDDLINTILEVTLHDLIDKIYFMQDAITNRI